MTLVFRGGNGKIYARTYLNYFFLQYMARERENNKLQITNKVLELIYFCTCDKRFFSPSFIVLQTTIEAQSIYINYTTSAHYYYLNEEGKI